MEKGENIILNCLDSKVSRCVVGENEYFATDRKRHNFNGKLAFAIAAAALGSSFQHGYNTGVINTPQYVIEEWIMSILKDRTGSLPEQETITFIWSLMVSMFYVGGMIGGALTGTVADTFGRKRALLYNNILVILAATFQGASKAASSFEMIILGRFLIGINSGLNAGLAPMYLAEISPINLRGAVGSVYPLIITISILVAQILGLESVLGSESHWPTLLAITVVPAIFQLVTLPICPESPKYLLLSKGKEVEAQRALTWLRGSTSVQDEMNEMRAEFESMKSVSKVTLRELVTNNALRMPLIISVVIMLAQQFSGINAVILYSTRIFTVAGLSKIDASYATLAIGFVNVFMTVVSLVFVEIAGRKTLLLIGFSGMTVDTLLLTVALLFVVPGSVISCICILLVVQFIIMFAIGPGSIPWFLVSELFNQSARPAAISLAVAVNWTANFIVGIGLLPLQTVLGPYVFLIFAVILALAVVFIYKKVPETKNKTMEEIAAMFRQQSYQ